MLRLLKRWLGWEEDAEYFDPDEFRTGTRRKSATAQILADRQSAPKPPRPDRAIDADSAKPEFDPYNTGKFDRSASWERISKNQR